MVYTILLLLYAWYEAGRHSLLPPRLRFTLLVSARHEEKAIAQTIRQMTHIDYPPELTEIIIVCDVKDRGTIREACESIRSVSSPSSARFKVTTFSDEPINKLHAFNAAMRIAAGDVVGVFDARDDVPPGILRTVNTILLQEPVDVVQGAVQFAKRESTLNSRLHHNARVLPLAGNALFVRRSKLTAAGVWDDRIGLLQQGTRQLVGQTPPGDLPGGLVQLGVRHLVQPAADGVDEAAPEGGEALAGW